MKYARENQNSSGNFGAVFALIMFFITVVTPIIIIPAIVVVAMQSVLSLIGMVVYLGVYVAIVLKSS